METLSLTIDGMSCGHCVKAVRQALEELPGVQVNQVAIGNATVAYDPEQVTRDAVKEAVADAGYQAHEAGR